MKEGTSQGTSNWLSRFAAKTMLDGATATSTAEAAAAGLAGADSWERLAAAAGLAPATG